MLPSDFHLEVRYRYSLLSEKEQELYLFMLECLLENRPRFFFAADEECLPSDEAFSDLPRFVRPYAAELNPFAVLRAIELDCPELYYFKSSILHFDVERQMLCLSSEDIDYSQVDFLSGEPIEYPTAQE